MTMTTVLEQQKKKSKISKKLQELLDSLATDFEKLQPKIDRIFEQGRKDGLKDMEIGLLIRQKMKVCYSANTITRVLPTTARQKQNHVNRGKVTKMVTSDVTQSVVELRRRREGNDLIPEYETELLSQYTTALSIPIRIWLR